MNKSELIASVADCADCPRRDAEQIVNAALEQIALALARGEKVQLSGFGTFEAKLREARVGRNPKTREPVEIPASVVPTFRPSKALKDSIEIK